MKSTEGKAIKIEKLLKPGDEPIADDGTIPVKVITWDKDGNILAHWERKPASEVKPGSITVNWGDDES